MDNSETARNTNTGNRLSFSGSALHVPKAIAEISHRARRIPTQNLTYRGRKWNRPRLENSSDRFIFPLPSQKRVILSF